eukprot:6887531-Prymnesium_polylepis.1
MAAKLLEVVAKLTRGDHRMALFGFAPACSPRLRLVLVLGSRCQEDLHPEHALGVVWVDSGNVVLVGPPASPRVPFSSSFGPTRAQAHRPLPLL